MKNIEIGNKTPPGTLAKVPRGLEDRHYNHFSRSQNSVNSLAKILVPSDDETRNIGIIKNRVFVKANFHSKRHLCRRYNAIGIDAGAFQEYILVCAESIEVQDRDENTTYMTTVKEFQSHCIQDDLGWGSQLFLPLPYWEKLERNAANPRQLALAFTGGERCQ
jgi:hypothetical protein